MTTCYLCIGFDYIEHASIKDAVLSFKEVAQELDWYGQRIEASIHIAKTRDGIHEYPDYVLSLGPRGGLVKQRT